MLVLAVHTVEAATAKVPFSMIVLTDLLKRKVTPEDARVRLIIPCGGLQSVSLWDIDDSAEALDALKDWLDANLGSDCISEVSEVAEDFTYGLSLELARVRAGDKMATGGKNAVEVLGETAHMAAGVLDKAVQGASSRLERFDANTGVLTATKQTTAAALSKVSNTMEKVMESERVSAVVSNVQQGVAQGWSKAGKALQWMGSSVRQGVEQVRGQVGRTGSGGTETFTVPDPHAVQPTDPTWTPSESVEGRHSASRDFSLEDPSPPVSSALPTATSDADKVPANAAGAAVPTSQ